ncbi:MAG: hypothetical protein JJT85_03070 [Chromatiales bacterium]|nr:hypothetical protein [Chromatiales bacterium]
MKTLMQKAMLPLLAMTMAGCASSRGPIIDTRGVDMAQYERDLAECEEYANQVNPVEGAARGAAAGGAVGAMTGAIGGNPGRGAGIGAVLGGSQSAAAGVRERDQVVKRCLRGRGYSVLN